MRRMPGCSENTFEALLWLKIHKPISLCGRALLAFPLVDYDRYCWSKEDSEQHHCVDWQISKATFYVLWAEFFDTQMWCTLAFPRHGCKPSAPLKSQQARILKMIRDILAYWRYECRFGVDQGRTERELRVHKRGRDDESGFLVVWNL